MFLLICYRLNACAFRGAKVGHFIQTAKQSRHKSHYGICFWTMQITKETI